MAYLRIWVHMVWSTKDRRPYMNNEGARHQMFAHISENAHKKDIYLDCTNGWIDHAHALISLGPDQSIAKISQLLKGESSHWANAQRIFPCKFEWQDDYFAVSVSDSVLDDVRSYILNQEEHHRKRTFSEECTEFLKAYRFPSIPPGVMG